MKLTSLSSHCFTSFFFHFCCFRWMKKLTKIHFQISCACLWGLTSNHISVTQVSLYISPTKKKTVWSQTVRSVEWDRQITTSEWVIKWTLMRPISFCYINQFNNFIVFCPLHGNSLRSGNGETKLLLWLNVRLYAHHRIVSVCVCHVIITSSFLHYFTIMNEVKIVICSK